MATWRGPVAGPYRPIGGIAFHLGEDGWTPWLPPEDHPAYQQFRFLHIQMLVEAHDRVTPLVERLAAANGEKVYVTFLMYGLDAAGLPRSCALVAQDDGDTIYYVHDEIKEQLREKIAGLGLQGGLLTYQLGPDRTSDDFSGYSHRLGLLGEITFDSQADQDAYFQRFQEMARRMGCLYVCGWWRAAQFRALPTTYPQALRLLLAGSSVNYRVRRLQYRESVTLDSAVTC